MSFSCLGEKILCSVPGWPLGCWEAAAAEKGTQRVKMPLSSLGWGDPWLGRAAAKSPTTPLPEAGVELGPWSVGRHAVAATAWELAGCCSVWLSAGGI